jgi:hypothetical protein
VVGEELVLAYLPTAVEGEGAVRAEEVELPLEQPLVEEEEAQMKGSEPECHHLGLNLLHETSVRLYEEQQRLYQYHNLPHIQ